MALREIKYAHENGLKLYYKQHQWETEDLDILCNEVELKRSISMKGYLSCASVKTVKDYWHKKYRSADGKKWDLRQSLSFVQLSGLPGF